MKKGRRKYSNDFKSKVALEAIKGDLTQAELTTKYEVQATQITRWKQELINNASNVFGNTNDKELKKLADERDELYREIGKLKVENDFIKKNLKAHGCL